MRSRMPGNNLLLLSILSGMLAVFVAACAAPAPAAEMPTKTAEPVPTWAPAASTQLPVATTAEPVLSREARIQQALEGLDAGKMLFNPPAEMQEGQAETLTLRITRDASETITATLEANVLGNGPVVIENINTVGTFMKASLQGEDGIEITELSSPEQVVGYQGFTEWTWRIQATQSGVKQLFLNVTTRIKLSESDQEEKDFGNAVAH